MSLGELPARTSMRGYWKLQSNGSDSSGNAIDLVSTNVGYAAARFGNGADFGNSPTTNRRLQYTNNPLTALQVANITFSIWFKLNNTTASSNGGSSDGPRFLELNTALTGTSGCYISLTYYISGSNIIFTGAVILTTTNSVVQLTTTPDTNWHNIVIVKSTTTNLELYYDGISVASNTGVGSDKNFAGGNRRLSIGTNAISTGVIQVWAVLDEAILEERAWSASEIRKYYTQARGRFAI